MATPAEPTFASTLWTSHLSALADPDTKSRPLAAGCRSIDNALGGGLGYGSVICLSAEANSGARALSQALLISHLLGSPDTLATVIDTTLSFDVREFHKAVNAEMAGESDAVQESLKVLDRLRIMKVFDFVGLAESIAELRDSLEGITPPPESFGQGQQAPRGTVGDSEDDDNDMLDSPSPPPPLPPRAKPTYERNEHKADCNLLIIDNITQVTAPLLKNNFAQGQAVLSSFMRSLSHFTKANNLCTVLTNHATPNPNIKDETPSIFSSCTVRPALGKTFAYSLDIHLLFHRAPKSADNARAVYGGASAEKRQKLAQMCNVLEVLQDRCGGRVGRWAAFNVDNDGRLVGVS